MEHRCSAGLRMVKDGVAAIWIRPRPESDPSLALVSMNVIINEGLRGPPMRASLMRRLFPPGLSGDRLKAHVEHYPLERMEAMTWVPADPIRDAALCT